MYIVNVFGVIIVNVMFWIYVNCVYVKIIGDFLSGVYQKYSVIQRVAEYIDMKNFCGYMILLNIGRELYIVWKEEYEEDFLMEDVFFGEDNSELINGVKDQ